MAGAVTESERNHADLLSAMDQSKAFKVAEDIDRQSLATGAGAAGTATASNDDATQHIRQNAQRGGFTGKWASLDRN